MKKIYFLASLVCLLLVGCKADDDESLYSFNNSNKRNYCDVTFVNATTNYAVKIFVDGEQLNSSILWKGDSQSYSFYNLSFSKYIIVEYYKIADESKHTYYTTLSNTTGNSVQFSSNLDYKFTIYDSGVHQQSVSAD